LKLPLVEQINAFYTELDTLERNVHRAIERIEDSNAKVSQFALAAGRHEDRFVGTAEVLAEARRNRDAALDAFVQRRHSEESREALKQYMALLAAADAVADDRFAAAEAISLAEAATRELKLARGELERRENEHAAAKRALEDAEQRWRAIWDSVGLTPLAPSEMLEWLKVVVNLRSTATEAAAIEIDLAELERERFRQVEMLRSALANAGAPVTTADRALLIRMASERVREITEQSSRLAELKRVRTREDLSMRSHDEEQRRLHDLSTDWRSRWMDALAKLHLPTDLAPGDANEVTNDIRTMFESLNNAIGFRKRIAGIERDVQNYRDRARNLISGVSAELMPTFEVSLSEAIKILGRQLDYEESRSSAAIVREQAKERLAESISRREAELLEHQSICDQLLAENRFEIGDATEVLDRSKRVHDLESSLQSLERDLHLSTGMRIGEIDEQVETRGADVIRSDLLAAEETLKLENDARDRLVEQSQIVRARLEEIEKSATASDLQGELLAIGAAIDRDARRYATLRTAAGILRGEVERYANAHQGPIVEAASEAFSVITQGAYSRVRAVGEEGDDLLLEAVAIDGMECGIDGLSDGTKDQLYLALRLATLSEYFKRSPVSLPVILDDVFVNFDDERTGAAFGALAGFSTFAQVIYFTHHEAAISMAERALGDRVDVIRLNSSAQVPAGGRH
jgi:uncharacterized protein YhaN